LSKLKYIVLLPETKTDGALSHSFRKTHIMGLFEMGLLRRIFGPEEA
jgi:hypothetical protein